jgi:hypothetical protein
MDDIFSNVSPLERRYRCKFPLLIIFPGRSRIKVTPLHSYLWQLYVGPIILYTVQYLRKLQYTSCSTVFAKTSEEFGTVEEWKICDVHSSPFKIGCWTRFTRYSY